jgi:hypothetical protein
MNKTDPQPPPAFGDVDMNAEHGIFVIELERGGSCRLTLVGHTERGYPRRELAAIPANVWKEIAGPVQNELIRGMEGPGDRKLTARLQVGENALSPLVTRELSVLLWALMEDEEATHNDALFAGWKQLACEERWWLYARASSTAQQKGQGWRRALFFALNDPADTRHMSRPAASPEEAAKKKSTQTKRTRSTGSATEPKSNEPIKSIKPKRAAEKSRVTTKTQPTAARPKKLPSRALVTKKSKAVESATKKSTPVTSAKKAAKLTKSTRTTKPQSTSTSTKPTKKKSIKRKSA